MIEKNGIKFISSGVLERCGHTAHGFLSRQGGFSRPPFDGLNLGSSGGDSIADIKKNLGLVESAFSIPEGAVVTVKQVHGNSVYLADGKTPEKTPEADAVITAARGLAIGVLTADCLPVLIYDTKARAAAAIHAGWRGTVQGVCTEAVKSMEKNFGSDPKDMAAALGPYIGPCCYEVQENVVEEFTFAFGKGLKYIKRNGRGIRLDIGMANVEQLMSVGLSPANIDSKAPCTSCNTSLFFSYRKEEGRTGRQLSFIMLK